MKELTPPQNIDAERSLLAALLLDKDAIGRVVDVVQPEDFYDDRHGLIFAAVRKLYDSHQPVDIVTVTEVLSSQGKLEDVGGASKLAALTNVALSAAHAVQYGEIIANKATLRRLISAASKITELGFTVEDEVDAVLDKAEQTLFNVSRRHLKTPFVPVNEVLTQAFERIDHLYSNRGNCGGLPLVFMIWIICSMVCKNPIW